MNSKIHHLLLAIILLAMQSIGDLCSQEQIKQNADSLVMIGPGHQFKEQIRYLEDTWPYNFSINVVKVVNSPECKTDENGYAYCIAKVKNIDSFYLRWVSGSLKSPGYEFKIQYWYKTANTSFILIKGETYIVFLAPTHIKDLFSPTLITTATAEYIIKLRAILAEYFN